MSRFCLIAISVLTWAAALHADEAPVHRFSGVGGTFIAERVLAGLSQPVAIEMLGDSRALVLQRNTGTLSLADFSRGTAETVSGLDGVLVFGDAGLHDAERHPDHANNGWIYLSYSVGEEIHSSIVLDRIRLDGSRIVEQERLFTADAWSESSYHCGGRIQFHDGHVYMTIGDRLHEDRAQDRSNHTGTILRLREDGSVPEDNPYVGVEGARPEIWSYGHRSPQGLFVDPETGDLWEHEHGPRGGDELNRIERGGNYGWPVISYGFQYDGGPIGKGIVQQEGMEQPLWVWVPSIAPSDLVIYRGDAFPAWRGSFLIGAMALTHLNRLQFAEGKVVLEERLAIGTLGRIRSIAVDDAGLVYLGSDSGDIWRLRPE